MGHSFSEMPAERSTAYRATLSHRSLPMTNAGNAAFDLLRAWVARVVPNEGGVWFEQQIALMCSGPAEKELYLALGYAIRRLGKQDLALTSEDLVAARTARPGWNPSDWSVDQAARLSFVLASDDGDGAKFKATARAAFSHRRHRRANHFLSRPAALSVSKAACCPGPRGRAQRNAADLRSCRTPQSLSNGRVRRERLEPHGAESALRRQQARSDPGS